MQNARENGIVLGLVIDLDDPRKLGRVRVKFPHLDDQPSDWAFLTSPMAGPDRGLFLRPEKGDEVLVAFEFGEPRRPYILGAKWSEADKPPRDDGNAVQNNWRFLKSRSGHVIKLDDTNGKEKIELIDKDNKHKVVIDSSARKIQVICDDGDVEVTATKGSVTVHATTVEVKATGDMTLQAGGTLTIKGATVNIN